MVFNNADAGYLSFMQCIFIQRQFTVYNVCAETIDTCNSKTKIKPKKNSETQCRNQ